MSAQLRLALLLAVQAFLLWLCLRWGRIDAAIAVALLASAALVLVEYGTRAPESTHDTMANLRAAQIGEYLSFVMFQLREYVTTISSVAEAIALSASKEDIALQERAERLKRSVSALNGKIARLLGDKTALTTLVPPTQTSVDLSALCRAVARNARQAFAPGGPAVRVVLEGELPPVRSDRRSIELSFLAVLQNALEACARHGGGVTVTLRRKDSNAVIEVLDDGGGIDVAVKPALFEPLVSARKGSPGLGLGLSMSRRFLERIGGDLSARSEDGRTVVRLEVPIDKALPKIRTVESTWAGRRAGE